MNIDYIGEALKSFTTCYLSWRSQLNSVAVFGTRFWEWWVNLVAGPTITLTFLLLSSGSWEAIVVEKILFGSKVFVYSWSLLRKFCKNAVIWDYQPENTWSWVDDLDMKKLLRKQEDTWVFWLAPMIMSKRREWMPTSFVARFEMKQSHTWNLRALTCNYLFPSRWQKWSSAGMQRKRLTQSS